jgi:hypothetical protein
MGCTSAASLLQVGCGRQSQCATTPYPLGAMHVGLAELARPCSSTTCTCWQPRHDMHVHAAWASAPRVLE